MKLYKLIGIINMALAEILLTHVGAAISRKVLELWIEDPDFNLNIATDLGSFFARYTTNAFTKNRATHYYERVTNHAAETLMYIFNSESSSFEENDLEAVAHSIGQTIDKVHFSSDIILKNNLSSEELAKYFETNQPDNILVGFSPDLKLLYKRLLIKASDLIIEVTVSMPRFEEKVFEEIFKREKKLYDLLEQVITKIQDLWEANQTHGSDSQAHRFESDYNLAIVRKLDSMELFGAGTRVRYKRYPLSVAYVSLSVTLSNYIPEEEENFDILDVGNALVGKNKLLILGEAGSGKTTLDRYPIK